MIMLSHEIYLEVRPEDIAYIQATFDSYEGVGIIRTVDRKKAVIALLVVDDFVDVARAILSSLKNDCPLAQIPQPNDIGDDWLLRELASTEE